jgi:hypothetical protein
MALIKRCVPPAPGMVPSVISGCPNVAVSAAYKMSHIIASSQPPPSWSVSIEVDLNIEWLAHRNAIDDADYRLMDGQESIV